MCIVAITSSNSITHLALDSCPTNMVTKVLVYLLIVAPVFGNLPYYVKPESSSSDVCPNQQSPCLTLDEYMPSFNSESFFSSGASLIFLAGNHTIRTQIVLSNVSNVSFKGSSDSEEVFVLILHDSEAAIACEGVTNMTIEGLVFILFSDPTLWQLSVLEIIVSVGVLVRNTSFLGRGDLEKTTSRAVYSQYSQITIEGCVFVGNTADDFGGAIVAWEYSEVTLKGNNFTENQANVSGGAIFAGENSFVTIRLDPRNHFKYNIAPKGGALACYGCVVDITENLILLNSDYEPSSCHHFEDFADNTAEYGGALLLDEATLYMRGSALTFVNNSALVDGGAIYSTNSTIMSVMNFLCLTGNKATENGGGIFHAWGALHILGSSNFAGNVVNDGEGGAILAFSSELQIKGRALFTANNATVGASISSIRSYVALKGEHVEFGDSFAAKFGGGISCEYSELISTVDQLVFRNNVAPQGGGLFSVQGTRHILKSATFVGNFAPCGSAVSSFKQNLTFHNATLTRNSGSALCAVETNVTFTGHSKITQNAGRLGGGGYVERSTISFVGYTVFAENTAMVGGALNVAGESIASFTGTSIFRHNNAKTQGGAMQVSDSTISLSGNIHFESNIAQSGGAMYFRGSAELKSQGSGTIINTTSNLASEYGGVIYHEDAATPSQCMSVSQEDSDLNVIPFLPECFMHVDQAFFISHANKAKDGSFLYGGLLDKCRITVKGEIFQTYHVGLLSDLTVSIEGTAPNDTNVISSPPYRLCLCEDDTFSPTDKTFSDKNCSSHGEVSVYRGETFSVYLLALAQGDSVVSTYVLARVSSTSRLGVEESVQLIPAECTELTYTTFSTSQEEELVLYPDGPCRDTGQATAILNVTILPCPDGFEPFEEQCICESRLRTDTYDAECVIRDGVYINRKSSSTFWLSGLYDNGTYEGLVLYEVCPAEYCTDEPVRVTLDMPDVQCAPNRTGVLCGACVTGYSLMLGSSRCQVCPDKFLALLIPFAAAGLILVAFLVLLKLTVVTGMINSVILYAHMVQANKSTFFPAGK